MKLNYRDPIWALAVIALILLVAYQCSSKRVAELEAEAGRADVKRIQAVKVAEIAQRDSAIATVRRNRIDDSLSFASLLKPLNASVAYWKKKASEVRPEVDKLADSIPVLKAYIAATDSVIKVQDSTISVQKNHIYAMENLHTLEVGEMAQKNIKTQELADVWQTESYRQEKNAAKEGRRKRFWRGIAVVGVSCAVVLGLTAN